MGRSLGTILAMIRGMLNQGRRFYRSTVGAIAVLLLAPSLSFAWGHLYALGSEYVQANIIYNVLRTSEIHYCVEILEPGFGQRSIEEQVDHALQVWLKPLQKKKLIGKVKTQAVSCNSPDFILKISIGKESEYQYRQHAAYQIPQKEGSHYYSLIRLNTDFRFKDPYGKGRNYAWVDFGDLNLGGMTAMKRLVWAEKKRSILQTRDLADYGQEDSFRIDISTYRVLVHEIGHSFGLCDMYQSELGGNCDPAFTSFDGNSAIMMSNEMLLPTADDQTGLIEVAKRLKAELKGQAYTSPYPSKPMPGAQTAQARSSGGSSEWSSFGNDH